MNFIISSAMSSLLRPPGVVVSFFSSAIRFTSSQSYDRRLRVFSFVPVAAEKLVRKMRGGAQAWLIRAATGDSYVVKFRENSQHRRILINEWIAGSFLEQLGLCAAKTALIHCSQEWLGQACDEGLAIEHGNASRIISPGLHLGSKV